MFHLGEIIELMLGQVIESTISIYFIRTFIDSASPLQIISQLASVLFYTLAISPPANSLVLSS